MISPLKQSLDDQNFLPQKYGEIWRNPPSTANELPRLNGISEREIPIFVIVPFVESLRGHILFH